MVLNPFAKLPPADEFLVEHAVGTYNRLAPPADKVITYAVPQKFMSLSGQDMKLKDKEGNVIARTDGKNLSIRSRCVLSDSNGKPVVCILEKVLAMSSSYFVYAFKCASSQRAPELHPQTHPLSKHEMIRPGAHPARIGPTMRGRSRRTRSRTASPCTPGRRSGRSWSRSPTSSKSAWPLATTRTRSRTTDCSRPRHPACCRRSCRWHPPAQRRARPLCTPSTCTPPAPPHHVQRTEGG